MDMAEINRNRTVDICVVVLDTTERMVLVDFGGEEPLWLALSQIDWSSNDDGKTHTITMPYRLAESEGLV